jgi:hypothetical protein
VEEIGKIVRERVRWDPIEVATHPVGLDQTLKELDDLIQKQSSTRVVLIAGIGGIGKSTLAKKIFNSRRSNFSRASYLSNFRDKIDLTSFQRQLLRDLLGQDTDIANTDIGKTILRKGLKGFKILIILDDVDDRDKIRSVLDMNAVGAGSLIFITSRDKYILRGSADTLLYDVKPLKRNHARVLFCHHAFHQSNPFEGYEDLVEEFLKICGGLPLCLKVLGEQLSGTLDGSYWKRQLEIFSQGLPLTEADTVINTLKWSYTAMEIDQQEMLLDVGCFFVGEDLELTVRVLEGLGYLSDARNCLESLRPKCLVDFNNDVETQDEIGKQGQDISISEGRHLILPTVLPQRSSKIIMQNQVRELARRIAREALRTMDKPLRLSCSIDIEKMLQLQVCAVLKFPYTYTYQTVFLKF